MRRWYRSELLTPTVAFGINGALYGTLLSRFPEIADHVGASAAGFGVALFAAAAGGLLGSVLAPMLVRRVAELAATTITACAFAVMTIAVAAAPSLVLLGCVFFVLGLFDGSHDVSMNALAVRTQQRLKTSIMGRAHATWSLLLTGMGAVGAAAAGVHLPVIVHVGIVATAAFALQLAVYVLGRRQERDRVVARGSAGTTEYGATAGNVAGSPMNSDAAGATPSATALDTAATRTQARPVASARRPLRWVLFVLGAAALAASFVESPGQEWTGLLLNREFAAGTATAAAAPVVFSAGLVISRLVLDAGTRRFGTAPMATVAGLGIALSMGAGLAVGLAGWSAPWAIAAIGLAGLAAGPVFPLLFGAADHMSARYGIAPATTASIASALSRIGAISAPLVVGMLAQAVGLTAVFAVMAVGGLVLLLALPQAVR